MRLKDRIAIVTGAARGIGQAYCLALSREGALVVAVDILSCAQTVADVQKAGGQVSEITTNIENWQAVQAMTASVLQHYGRIDILVNNAALIPKLAPFDEVSEDEWDQAMAVNVKGMWLFCKAVIPIMRQQGKGRIIVKYAIANGYLPKAEVGASQAKRKLSEGIGVAFIQPGTHGGYRIIIAPADIKN